MAVKKRGLGKGLEALFAENSTEKGNSSTILKISEIVPNKNQPRKVFDDDSLEDLASSIKTHGVLQPLIVRPFADGTYQLVAGERRFRACHLVGISDIPVIIMQLDDRQVSEIALIENLQREDLNPIEESSGFKLLMDEFNLTQEEVAKAVGKSRSAVANSLRLLSLPQSVLKVVSDGKISAGHARAILSFEGKSTQEKLAEDIIKKDLTVREVEKMAKKMRSQAKLLENKDSIKNGAEALPRNSFYSEVELAMTEYLGRKVEVVESKNGGTLQIEFYSQDDLRMLANDMHVE